MQGPSVKGFVLGERAPARRPGLHTGKPAAPPAPLLDPRAGALTARLARESPDTTVAAIRGLAPAVQAAIVTGLRVAVERDVARLQAEARR